MKNPRLHEGTVGSHEFVLLLVLGFFTLFSFLRGYVTFLFFPKCLALTCRDDISLPYTFVLAIFSKLQEKVHKYSEKTLKFKCRGI